MLSLVVCRCLFRLMRRCFLGRWICLLVSERFRLVWKCRLFGYSTYTQSCMHWHGGQILNKSRRQHPTRHLLYGLLPPITKTIQVRRTRHAGHCWRRKDSYGPPHMLKQKQDDQLEHTYSNYVSIRDVVLKTCQKRWMIGRRGERQGQGYPC